MIVFFKEAVLTKCHELTLPSPPVQVVTFQILSATDGANAPCFVFFFLFGLSALLKGIAVAGGFKV